MRNLSLRASVLLLAVVFTAPVLAQSTLDWPLGEYATYPLDSGRLANAATDFAVVYQATVTMEDAVWLRLYFGGVDLEPGSLVRVTSALDGEVQELDTYELGMWNNTSAYFNGDTVYLELVAAPGTRENRVVLEQVGVYQVDGGWRGPCADDNCGICGSDNRTPSDEEWSGRLLPVGCTGSVYNEESCIVSAGHCADGGWDDVIQFNVPNSDSDCYPNNPPVADQFPIVSHMFTNGGVGNDWSVMIPGTNNYGQTPYERYGVYMPLASSPANAGATCTVWGYGVDNGQPTRSQTQQTSSGPINQRYSTYYTYTIDTTYGNSGSGVVYNGAIVGIVTHCSIGCPNYATRIDLSAFENAREQLCGGGSGGYCAASSDSTSYEYISRVQVGSINNPSGSSGYADYTNLSTDMETGNGYPITVTLDTDWSSDIGGLWVDWNQDGDFYDSGETITTSWSGLGPYTTTIVPPASAAEGDTRMRVRIQDGDYDPSLSPCGNTSYGEVEDYTVNVGGCVEPEFIVQPEPSQEVCLGDNAYLFVQVDIPLPAYQWRRGTIELVDDGGHIVGANTQTLFILGVTPADEAGNYNCEVTNLVDGCTATSNNAEILVDQDVPVILSQPQDATVTEGDAVFFAVGVDNPLFYTFQWRRNGVDLSDGNGYYGSATHTLTINPVELGDAGLFDCVVTSQFGGMCSTTSDQATLTVNPAEDCPGDLDGDGDVDLADLSQLLGHYGMTSGADPEDGDMDGDGDVDLADLSALLAVYGTTCP